MRSRASHDFFHPRWGVIGEDTHLAAVKGVANLQILDEYSFAAFDVNLQ